MNYPHDVQCKSPLVDAAQIAEVDVCSVDGKYVGSISELVIDTRSGKIAYLLLSLDTGEVPKKLLAVPWSTLHYDAGNQVCILNVTKRQLEHVSGFDEDEWASIPDRDSPGDITIH
jgi:sporulation protein YlmC with PRC-barrel domain